MMEVEAPDGAGSVLTRIRQAEQQRQRDELLEAVRDYGGNLSHVAKALGLSRGGVIYRCKKWGLMDSIAVERTV